MPPGLRVGLSFDLSSRVSAAVLDLLSVEASAIRCTSVAVIDS
jgi:hypothetical protein